MAKDLVTLGKYLCALLQKVGPSLTLKIFAGDFFLVPRFFLIEVLLAKVFNAALRACHEQKISVKKRLSRFFPHAVLFPSWRFCWQRFLRDVHLSFKGPRELPFSSCHAFFLTEVLLAKVLMVRQRARKSKGSLPGLPDRPLSRHHPTFFFVFVFYKNGVAEMGAR